jgi:endonuclease/exonuclease/phosphatase family metal-dependent hydrolase
MRSRLTALLVACATLALPLLAAQPSSAVEGDVRIKTVAFNVLAPCWASPTYYPSPCAAALDADTRRASVLRTLRALPDVDAYALQETQIDENPLLAAGLGRDYTYFAAYHDDTYWSSWITPAPAFARNGVALAINNKTFDNCTFTDLPLGTGNHAAVAVCRHKALRRLVRIASVHLDSDYGGRRGKEARALAAWFSGGTNAIDLIAGDLNADTDTGVVQQRITAAGFTDVLRAVGVDENTHPWTSSYNGNSMFGNIDHVMARGKGVRATGGQVHTNDLWTIHPVLGGSGEPNESQRICANLQLTGSDHFPVDGTITVTP